MDDLEAELRTEVQRWRERATVQEKAQARKSRINLLLAAVLGSSLFAAAATEVGQIVRGEYQEDIRRCELALGAIDRLTTANLTGFSDAQAALIRDEVVDMMDANCHIEGDEE